MTQELTADEWERQNDRPAWVRVNRERIMAAVDVDDDIPTDLRGVSEWLDRYKGVVTRELNEEQEDIET